jgi:hypothetical protein
MPKTYHGAYGNNTLSDYGNIRIHANQAAVKDASQVILHDFHRIIHTDLGNSFENEGNLSRPGYDLNQTVKPGSPSSSNVPPRFNLLSRCQKTMSSMEVATKPPLGPCGQTTGSKVFLVKDLAHEDLTLDVDASVVVQVENVTDCKLRLYISQAAKIKMIRMQNIQDSSIKFIERGKEEKRAIGGTKENDAIELSPCCQETEQSATVWLTRMQQVTLDIGHSFQIQQLRIHKSVAVLIREADIQALLLEDTRQVAVHGSVSSVADLSPGEHPNYELRV